MIIVIGEEDIVVFVHQNSQSARKEGSFIDRKEDFNDIVMDFFLCCGIGVREVIENDESRVGVFSAIDFPEPSFVIKASKLYSSEKTRS